ncbi:MAG: hypothetical protein IKS41_04490 [Alphaproteobacteria bacterium]|nr:hypothetical protein [Alphaproteobacteria bacterium]
MPIITKYYPRLPGQKRKVRERYVVDETGAKQGLYQSYYKNGQDKVTCSFKDDVKHGPYVSKHPNGRPATMCTYEDGCLEGKMTCHDKMGVLLFEGNYHRNMGEGEQTYYRSNGEMSSRENRHLGRREGECVTWMADEVERMVYRAGEEFKIPQLSTGRITKIVQEFSDDIVVRQVNYLYNAEQALEEKIEFDQKTDVAQHTYYFPNGRIRLVCGKRGESMEGPYTRFFESGRKAEEGTCERNRPHGAQIFYYDNERNSKKEESTSVRGELDGICIRYDEMGRVVEKCRYDHGKRIIFQGMSEIIFNKKAERTVRDATAQEIVDLRRQGKKNEAVLLARQFDSEQSDIPRRTALRRDKENCRS